MSSYDQKSSEEEEEEGHKNINFQALKSLLQRCLNEKELQVITHSITKLLPAGENYGSIILKIDVNIRRNKMLKEETLHLIAKTPSSVENSLIHWPSIFKKEVFMYAELFPLYRELEEEAEIDKDKLINILPKYIGYRNSLNNGEEVDNNSALLLENLQVLGYYTVNRRVGLDLAHALKVLPLLARYHALGIVIQQKRPSFAKKVIDQARILGTDFTQLDSSFAGIHEAFVTSKRLQKYLVAIESSFQLIKAGGTWKAAPTEPWASITHGDFWTSNILFHKDDSGYNIDDVKFVDFQGYLYSSPLKDLLPFFTTCIDEPTQTNHLEELVDLYYDSFVKTLKRMNCDDKSFTRTSFDHELKKQAIVQLPICALANKFMVTQVLDEDKSNEELLQKVFNAGPSDAFIDRLIWILQIYERMKWL